MPWLHDMLLKPLHKRDISTVTSAAAHWLQTVVRSGLWKSRIKNYKIQNGQGELVMWTAASNPSCIAKVTLTTKHLPRAYWSWIRAPEQRFFLRRRYLLIADAWSLEGMKTENACSKEKIKQNEGMGVTEMTFQIPKHQHWQFQYSTCYSKLVVQNDARPLLVESQPLSPSRSRWESINLVFSKNSCSPYLTQHKGTMTYSFRDIWQP